MKGTKEDHNVTDVSGGSHNLAVNREEIDGDIVLFATTTRWLHIITTNKENDLQSARAAEPWNSPKLFLIGSFPLQYLNLHRAYKPTKLSLVCFHKIAEDEVSAHTAS